MMDDTLTLTSGGAMARADLISAAARSAIEHGSLGEPKFARLVAHAPLSGLLGAVASRLVSMCEEWFGQPCATRDTRREASGVSVTELLSWADGQGALIVVAASPPRSGPILDLMLIGSRGALYYSE